MINRTSQLSDEAYLLPWLSEVPNESLRLPVIRTSKLIKRIERMVTCNREYIYIYHLVIGISIEKIQGK